ncbi:hypothetical protein BGC33_06905 [Bathymodiolus thermophilus thioautotrophic gill symbiont]|uniref:Uncharacterized protein n=1 Tax=Bathymodiolus thermophilus thioautotrophic gill symbiont TaxID=2360 RepID=A0A1J5UHY3_9GAMM|nr:hypothetical protein BGC33_06905 [Bathymodiolus thermophilus thioautotrophic gill symbiont]
MAKFNFCLIGDFFKSCAEKKRLQTFPLQLDSPLLGETLLNVAGKCQVSEKQMPDGCLYLYKGLI